MRGSHTSGGRSGARPRRPSRTKLGKGQSPQLPTASCRLNIDADTLKLTFNVPIVVDGPFDLQVDGLTLQTQFQIDPQTWLLTYDDDLDGHSYAGIAYGDPVVKTMQGGAFVGIPPGTFD